MVKNRFRGSAPRRRIASTSRMCPCLPSINGQRPNALSGIGCRPHSGTGLARGLLPVSVTIKRCSAAANPRCRHAGRPIPYAPGGRMSETLPLETSSTARHRLTSAAHVIGDGVRARALARDDERQAVPIDDRVMAHARHHGCARTTPAEAGDTFSTAARVSVARSESRFPPQFEMTGNGVRGRRDLSGSAKILSGRRQNYKSLMQR